MQWLTTLILTLKRLRRDEFESSLGYTLRKKKPEKEGGGKGVKKGDKNKETLKNQIITSENGSWQTLKIESKQISNFWRNGMGDQKMPGADGFPGVLSNSQGTAPYKMFQRRGLSLTHFLGELLSKKADQIGQKWKEEHLPLVQNPCVAAFASSHEPQ